VASRFISLSQLGAARAQNIISKCYIQKIKITIIIIKIIRYKIKIIKIKIIRIPYNVT